jgi:hypothetical protein
MALGPAGGERQHRTEPVQNLNGRFFIHAEDMLFWLRRAIRWVRASSRQNFGLQRRRAFTGFWAGVMTRVASMQTSLWNRSFQRTMVGLLISNRHAIPEYGIPSLSKRVSFARLTRPPAAPRDWLMPINSFLCSSVISNVARDDTLF